MEVGQEFDYSTVEANDFRIALAGSGGLGCAEGKVVEHPICLAPVAIPNKTFCLVLPTPSCIVRCAVARNS